MRDDVAGLAAGGHRLDHGRAEALRGGVHGGGETGRTGADDQDIAAAVARFQGRQADQPGQFGVARIAQQGGVPPDHQRRLLRADPEAAQQSLGLLVRLQIDPAVRQPVAGGELAQPTGVGRIARADDAETGSLPDEQSAAAQAGAQHHVTEHGVPGHQVTHLIHGQGEDLARVPDHGGVEGHLSFQEAEFADEAARAVHTQQAFAGCAVALDDGDRATEDDVEHLAPLALPDQHVTCLGGVPSAVLRQAGRLVVRQAGIGAVDVGSLEGDALLHLVRHRRRARPRLVAGHHTNASWTKHHRQSSPGSSDATIGWPSAAAWRRACRFGEESQQPTWPQVRQSLRWTHGEPSCRHS